MMWLDIKYASLLSPQLERYKVTKNNPFTATFRCPLCGDSQKSKSKTRGYFYVAYQKMRMKCHNCGASYNFKNFLKTLDNNLFKQYTVEAFSGQSEKTPDIDMMFHKPVFEAPKDSLIDHMMDRLDTLSEDHEAVQYVESRLIPRDKFHRLYYVEDVSKIGQLKDKYREKITGKESRIALPFYDRQGRLTGLTMRAIDDHPIRYLAINIVEDVVQIYNLDAVDFSKPVVCVEGPLDSLFLSNAVAVGGSAMKSARKLLPSNTIYVFDNEPRNKEICELIHKQIESGFTVCIWPENITEKDINEMVKVDLDVEDIIYKNSCSGLEARMKFSHWRKC
jgi:transcription elongation factor Elf1